MPDQMRAHAPSQMPILEVKGLHVRYGAVVAVNGIDLEVGPNDAVALLGPNGAGKSSTLDAISRLIPAEGDIVFDGESVRGVSPEALARRGLVHVPEGRHVFPGLSVHENFQVATTMRHRRPATFSYDDVYDLFPPLVPLRKRQGWMLSGGEQQMVAVGRALLGSPRMLMLDEPSLGLAPIVITAVFDALAQVRGTTALLVVEQNTTHALALCDRASVLVQGKVALVGASSEILDSPSLLDTYLGRRDIA
jgi:branched-chain amino acid transport system ATP-binding protein